MLRQWKYSADPKANHAEVVQWFESARAASQGGTEALPPLPTLVPAAVDPVANTTVVGPGLPELPRVTTAADPLVRVPQEKPQLDLTTEPVNLDAAPQPPENAAAPGTIWHLGEALWSASAGQFEDTTQHTGVFKEIGSELSSGK